MHIVCRTCLCTLKLFGWGLCRTTRKSCAASLTCTLFSSLAWYLLRSLLSNVKLPSRLQDG